mgnify:CR=1 FL=1
MPSGFSHISLPTRDLAESTRFFTEVLGGEERSNSRMVPFYAAGIAVMSSRVPTPKLRFDNGAAVPPGGSDTIADGQDEQPERKQRGAGARE